MLFRVFNVNRLSNFKDPLVADYFESGGQSGEQKNNAGLKQ